MHEKLIEEVRDFVARKRIERLAATCHVAKVPGLTGNPAEVVEVTAERRNQLLQGLSRRIRRERIRGLRSAHDYDLDLHIALKQLRDILDPRPPVPHWAQGNTGTGKTTPPSTFQQSGTRSIRKNRARGIDGS